MWNVNILVQYITLYIAQTLTKVIYIQIDVVKLNLSIAPMNIVEQRTLIIEERISKL